MTACATSHVDADSTDHAPVPDVLAAVARLTGPHEGRRLRLLRDGRGATQWVSVLDEILAGSKGYLGPRRRAGTGGGTRASTASSTSSTPRARDHYAAWQQQRMLAMLAETRRPPGRVHPDRDPAARGGNAPRFIEGLRGDRGGARPALRYGGLAVGDLLQLGLGPGRGRRLRFGPDRLGST